MLMAQTNSIKYHQRKGLNDLTHIFYSSFGKVTFIKYKEKLSNKSYSLILGYGPLKERVYSNNSKNNTTKYYVDNIYERVETAGRINHVNYILAAGKAVAMVTQSDDMADDVQYIHHDHLGSIQALTDKNGALTQEFSYDAWGMRRNPDTWEVYALSTDADAKCDYGFGGHEHIDIFDLVNLTVASMTQLSVVLSLLTRLSKARTSHRVSTDTLIV